MFYLWRYSQVVRQRIANPLFLSSNLSAACKLTLICFIIKIFNIYEFIIKTSLVQSVERRFPKPDVVGSIPTGRG